MVCCGSIEEVREWFDESILSGDEYSFFIIIVNTKIMLNYRRITNLVVLPLDSNIAYQPSKIIDKKLSCSGSDHNDNDGGNDNHDDNDGGNDNHNDNDGGNDNHDDNDGGNDNHNDNDGGNDNHDDNPD